MKKKVFKISLLSFLPILFIFGLYLYGIGDHKFKNISVKTGTGHDNNKLEEKVDLPLIVKKGENIVSQFTVIINRNWFHTDELWMRPDDCLIGLNINNKLVDLSKFKQNLCYNQKGFKLDLSEYWTKGKNTLILTVDNRYGLDHGLALKTQAKTLSRVGLAIMLLAALISIWGLKKEFQWPLSICLILTLSLFLKFYYFNHTDPKIRAHDVDGHIEYIEYIIDNNDIPAKNECWQCYHPPLYFISTALYTKFIGVFANTNPLKVMQSFSLFLAVVFLIYGTLILQLITPKKFLSPTVIFLAFWPASIMYAARIGNDSLLYLTQAIGLYHLLIWDGANRRHLIIAVILWGVSVYVKTNGLFLVLAIGLKYFIVRLKDKSLLKTSSIYEISILLAIIIFFSSFFFYERSNYQVARPHNTGLVIGNLGGGLPSHIKLENKLENYLLLDIKDFLTEPYTNPYQDVGGRQQYWNFMLQTAMVGEQDHGHVNKLFYILLFLKLFALLGLIIACFGALSHISSMSPNLYTVTFYGLMLLFASMGLRWMFPVSPSQDFRYIFTTIFAFIPLFILGATTIFKSFSLSVVWCVSIVLALCTSYFYIVIS